MILTFLFTGGAEGARTPDLMTASHALSQLSYSPNCEKKILTNANYGVNIYFVQNLFISVPPPPQLLTPIGSLPTGSC